MLLSQISTHFSTEKEKSKISRVESCKKNWQQQVHYMIDKDLFIIEAIETVDKIQNKKEIHCTTRINEHEVQLRIDTVAKCNVMTLDLFKKLRDGEKLKLIVLSQ